ncbi:MAG: GntR family transcriptional regulator [Pseudomonadota bacterium]
MTEQRRRIVKVPDLGYEYEDVGPLAPSERRNYGPRKNLHATTTYRVRQLILDGELPPGQRISEHALCERCGVSRTPVREALKALAIEGLVKITPNRGATVVTLSPIELTETFAVMGALEALAGELACQNMNDGEIDYISELHDRMVDHYKRREIHEYFSVNQRIHDAILFGSRNDVLGAQYRQLAGRIRLARYQANFSERRWAQAIAEHKRILAALKKRDGKRVARLLRAHLNSKLISLLDVSGCTDS